MTKSSSSRQVCTHAHPHPLFSSLLFPCCLFFLYFFSFLLLFHVPILPLPLHLYLFTAGCFELSCLHLSKYFNLTHDYILFGNKFLPREALIQLPETYEIRLILSVFDFVRSIAELELTETELGLYSAYTLLNPGKHKDEKAA